MTEQVEVTQADREAAASLWKTHHGEDALWKAILEGDADNCAHVQAFAGHRPDTPMSALPEDGKHDGLLVDLRSLARLEQMPLRWQMDIACRAIDRIETLSREIERVRREAARIARFGCLVPPDGGEPTESERQMCEDIAESILAIPLTTGSAAGQDT